MFDHCHKTEINQSCIICGRIRYPENFKPYSVITINIGLGVKHARSQHPCKGTCINCERPDLNLHRGLCGACRNVVNGAYGKRRPEDGSVEYYAALKAYRERRWPERFKKVA